MRAGKLRHRATIQSRSTVRDAYGGESVAWEDVVEVWCSIEPLEGRELLAAQQIQSEVTTRITLRYRAGVVPEWRVLHEGVLYDIMTVVDPELRHEELRLMCSRGLKDG